MEINKITIKIILTIAVIVGIAYSLVPGVRNAINEHVFMMTRIDEETDYTNRKMVEDTARALITNYEAAKSEYENYEQYIGTKDKAREQRALDAKTSANMTVSKYNNYLTENEYIFKGNLPNGIPYKLEKVGN